MNIGCWLGKKGGPLIEWTPAPKRKQTHLIYSTLFLKIIPLFALTTPPSPSCPPPGPPSSPEYFLVGVPFKPLPLGFKPFAAFSPFAVRLSPFNTPLTASARVPPGLSSGSGSGRLLDNDLPPGEAADGEEALALAFPFGPGERGREGLV